jgi:acetyl-CoA carboxylase / biotin carboxylase 1
MCLHHINRQASYICFRGHASEKPELPCALGKANIIFLGPRENAMAALGDKVGSSILAQSAGVPTLPWSGSGVTIFPAEGHNAFFTEIPPNIYRSACVDSVAAAVASCTQIGYPAMLKVLGHSCHLEIYWLTLGGP